MTQIRIAIKDMLRIEKAELELEPGRITVVSGQNRAGKTSIATLAGAIMSGNANPAGASKSDAKVYIRDGADTGTIRVFLDNNPYRSWEALENEITNFGEQQNLGSDASLGLLDFTGGMTPKARTEMFEEYFLPPPKELADLIRTELEHHLQGDLLNDIMNSIDEGNLEAIHKSYTERMRARKRDWTKITGVPWGKKVAADWIPENWTSELDGMSVKSMD